MESLLPYKENVRVSSVLNRDTKQYGKKFLFDGEEDTCWNSDQGTPQWVDISFNSPVLLDEIRIKFQGGFAGQECYIEGTGGKADVDGSRRLAEFYPEDINSLQVFKTKCETPVNSLRIVFGASTDFFGRITVYQLEVYGSKA